MTEFRVLPIRCGDAYFLKSRRGDYLFDGGVDGGGITELLSDRSTRRLRAAVCTSACRERLGGILDLMENGNSIAEYWLPSSLKELTSKAAQFNNDWSGWAQESIRIPRPDKLNNIRQILHFPLRSSGWLDGSCHLIRLATAICLNSPAQIHIHPTPRRQWTDTADNPTTPFLTMMLELLADRACLRWRNNRTAINSIFRRMGWRFFNGGGDADMAILCGRLLLAEADLLAGGEERGAQSLVTTLALTAMTAALIAKTSPKVRFIRDCKQLEEHLMPRHPIRCINGKEEHRRFEYTGKTTPKSLLRTIKSMTGHKGSLVFQYGDSDCGALMCGDTKLTFLKNGERLQIDRPTVIAAPRQGSPASERTYAHIESTAPERDIWVRSHFSNSRKISVLFKEQPDKLCLFNCRNQTLQEVMLQFSNSAWLPIAGGNCACDVKPKAF